MILTLTLNPALDKSTEIEQLVPEKKMRCAAMQIEAGGGGINISKAINELNGESLALFPSGGNNGALLHAILERSGIRYHSIGIEGETRESFVATEKSSNKQYRFVMPGPELLPQHLEACLQFIRDMKPLPAYMACSGSMPPGVPESFLGDLATLCREKGIRLIVDTSGPALKKVLEHGLFMIKPNLSELCSLVGKDFLELSEIDDAAKEVLNWSGCTAVIASMGPRGAMLVTKDMTKRIVAPEVRKLSTVGAGDSMVAGLLWKLESGSSLHDAAMFGVACGSAATMNKGTNLFRKDVAERLYKWMLGANA